MKKKLLSGAIALTLGVGVMTAATPAPPAQAAPSGAFEIFYGPNCGAGGTASRVYNTSLNSTKYGEPWINDKFNLKRFGSKGYGQKIKSNAASVWVESGNVEFWFALDGRVFGQWVGERFSRYPAKARTCVNFDDLTIFNGQRTLTFRNHNSYFRFG